jgi:hypothetical protein
MATKHTEAHMSISILIWFKDSSTHGLCPLFSSHEGQNVHDKTVSFSGTSRVCSCIELSHIFAYWNSLSGIIPRWHPRKDQSGLWLQCAYADACIIWIHAILQGVERIWASEYKCEYSKACLDYDTWIDRQHPFYDTPHGAKDGITFAQCNRVVRAPYFYAFCHLTIHAIVVS